MATVDYFSAASTLLGGIGDYFGAQAQAESLTASAATYKKAAKITETATKFKLLAESRLIYQTLGAGRAAIGASGLALGGSAEDVMRASAAEGSIATALIALQGKLESTLYKGQAAAATAAASAAEEGGLLSLLGSVVGAAGSVALAFSDDRLKVDISHYAWLPDKGLNLYRFRYFGSQQFYVGVLASEVERVRPDAIAVTAEGHTLVDYGKLGIELLLAGTA